MAMGRTSKQLLCPACGQVMADAAWRLWTGLTITSPEGYQITQVTGQLLLTIAQQHLAAASAEDHAEAQRRLDFILRNSGDRLYDLKCPQGHFTLRTAPQITHAVRHEPGAQVSLA
jgi:hypothetical protein